MSDTGAEVIKPDPRCSWQAVPEVFQSMTNCKLMQQQDASIGYAHTNWELTRERQNKEHM